MKNKECFAITNNSKQWLSMIQEADRDIFVMESDNILSADLFESFEQACSIVLELSNEKETEWQYSQYYKKGDLQLVRINLLYEAIGMVN